MIHIYSTILLFDSIRLADPWERVPWEQLSATEKKHISAAWSVDVPERHIYFLLNDARLYDIEFISVLSEDRRRISETNLEKKSNIISAVSVVLLPLHISSSFSYPLFQES